MALKPICKKCIHDFGDGCEAFRDEYMRIYLEMSICESMTKVDVMTLMMEHAILFLLNLLMEKMNNQKKGTNLLSYGIVQNYS